ncbi:hypothetical protein SNOG_10417 [Parastagonospora nodorum SN15]|uniref:Uncharacterized protein n=1 Tax=Phaeosphaeria nodorum (strain SN15 / ATCC MYA-4574 / FGSC 10173) TaxID=321614 RepID=Q0UCU7_PHANO|nr:hypothetical protein SNOG_10417 [Parastagonospora nodorum SN15]EAT81811.1 hypothetical protein SNOG_10417 [Parastagonospora nodorum SN15]
MVQSRQKLLEAALKGTKAQLAKTREQNVELSVKLEESERERKALSFVSLGVTPEGKVEYVPDQVQKPTGLDKPARVAKRSHSEIEARCKDYDTDTCKRQSCLRAHAEDEGSYKNLEYLPHISKYVVNTSGSKKRKTGGGLGRKKGL